MSVAKLELVTGMPEIPHSCVLCGNNPVEEQTGEQQQHIFAPGVDVDWGSSVYICNGCGQIIADLLGRVTVGGFDKLEAKYKALEEEHEELLGKYEKASRFVARIQDGKQALKEAKAEGPPKETKRGVKA